MAIDMLRRSCFLWFDDFDLQAVFSHKKIIPSEERHHICSDHFIFISSDCDIHIVYRKDASIDIFDGNGVHFV